MTFDEAMEPLFRYVDGLSDEQRDRIVTAQLWDPTLAKKDEPWCLVMHAYGQHDWFMAPHTRRYFLGLLSETQPLCYSLSPAYYAAVKTTSRFDRACGDFGRDRVVTALKARAGATVSLPLPESAREAVAK